MLLNLTLILIRRQYVTRRWFRLRRPDQRSKPLQGNTSILRAHFGGLFHITPKRQNLKLSDSHYIQVRQQRSDSLNINLEDMKKCKKKKNNPLSVSGVSNLHDLLNTGVSHVV